MISKLTVRGLVLASALFLGACGTMSQYNGYVTAPPEAKKAVESGAFVEEAVAQIAIVQNPDFNGGKISVKALKKIQEYGMSCQRQIDAQLAGPGQSGAGGALSYGLAGTGTGAAADLAFGNAVKMGEYAIYGGVAYILPGAVNGLVTGSYAMASAKGTCTRDFWGDIAKTDPDFAGTHVEVVHAGKARNSLPPSLSRPAAKPPAARIGQAK